MWIKSSGTKTNVSANCMYVYQSMRNFRVYTGYVNCTELAIQSTCSSSVAENAMDFWYVSSIEFIRKLVPRDCPLIDRLSGKEIWPGCVSVMGHGVCAQSRWHSSLPGRNGPHFAWAIFRCIFANEKFCTLIKILLKFVLKDPIDNNPALVWTIAWCRIGDKPLS